MTSTDGSVHIAGRLNQLLALAGEATLEPDLAARFETYLSLLLRWNARLNLTAIRDAEGILSRHFVESIVCARAIPQGVDTLLDFGSGAGFPGIPIALCRPEMAVTLAESQIKKAGFLREAMRTLGLNASVYGNRVESLKAIFDGVTMRAVDRMEQAVVVAANRVRPGGWLILMTTGQEEPALRVEAGAKFEWSRTVPLPFSDDRVIVIGSRGE